MAEAAVEKNTSSITVLDLLQAFLFSPPPGVAEFLPGAKPVKPSFDWETEIHNFVERFQLKSLTLAQLRHGVAELPVFLGF
jgi:hypothetical protein